MLVAPDNPFDGLAFAALPLASFWAMYNSLLSASEFVNNLRDAVLSGRLGGNGISPSHRRVLFWDWILCMIGTGSACLAFAGIIAFSGYFACQSGVLGKAGDEIPLLMSRALYVTAGTPIIGFGILIACGVSDYRHMKEAMQLLAAPPVAPPRAKPPAAPVAPPAPAPVATSNALPILMVVAAGLTVLYWILFLLWSAFRDADDVSYLTFEKACIVPDLFMATCFMWGGVQMLRGRKGERVAMLGAASMLYLGLLDASFNVQRCCQSHGWSIMEMVVNTACIGFSVAVIRALWRR